MALDLKGKTALVTGAGSGISLAFAQQLLQKGCNVVMVDLAMKSEAEKTVKGYSSGETRAIFIKIDVTDWTQLQTAFDTAINTFGSLDIVCPGAGIFEPRFSCFWEFPSPVDTPAASSYKTLDVNLTHPIRCTQLAIDAFFRQGHKHGVVVHISSTAAQFAGPPIPLYSVSKAAVSHFVRSMGPLEQMLGIKVVSVAPGATLTGIWDYSGRHGYVDEEKGDAWVMPEEIAEWMVTMVEQKEYEGGTVLEIGKGNTRKVQMLNDPGPDWTAKGIQMSNVQVSVKEMEERIEKNFGR